jgi:hypothetical protein
VVYPVTSSSRWRCRTARAARKRCLRAVGTTELPAYFCLRRPLAGVGHFPVSTD